ncbi:MAG TPA: universal stress protein [Planctomycetota bacterium]|nr:universal stress protein [Planctomycetota bacterium]
MIAFKNIILTTDLSDNALAAAPYAAELARQSKGTVYLLHVFEDSAYASDLASSDMLGFDPAAVEAAAVAERKARLQAWVEKIPGRENIKIVPVLKKGHAVEMILNEAKEVQADILVIATHGRTGLAHFLSGSVAEKIVRLSACPVLTVRPAALELNLAHGSFAPGAPKRNGNGRRAS